MNIAKQVATLLLATGIIMGVAYTSLAPYTPAILALLALAALSYALFRKKRRRGQELFIGNNKEVFVIIVFVLLIVFMTGGISSPVFFLTYFIIFGLAFIFEPLMIFFFLLCLGAIFAPQVMQDDIFGNSLKVASLLFLAPIAYFFGREYKRREKLKAEIQAKTEAIITDAEEVIKTKDKNTRLKKAEDIIENAQELQKEGD